MADLTRRIAFSMIKGLTMDTANDLLQRVGDLDSFFDKPCQQLWQEIGAQKSFCTDRERAQLLSQAAKEVEFVQSKHVKPVFMLDDDFPQRLRECCDAPTLLYSLGPCNLNAAHIVSVVGTRRSTAYGSKITSDIISGLASKLDDLVIVSGLAYGIDVCAHRAALDANIPTVGVVAHGLKTLYPAEHRDIAARMIREGGAIVTEYTSDAPVHRGNFLARNRIVAGLADITLVVESDSHGGAMVTASIANSYGRDVGAVPGRTIDRFSQGPNALIFSNKASIIRDADDIVELMNWETKPTEGTQQTFNFADLSDEQRQVVDFLRRQPSANAEDMARELQVPYAKLNSRLMQMEMADLLTTLPGGQIQLNI